jgi:hypothetical protein
MAIKNKPMIVNYTAWNKTTNTGKTGDASNHELYIAKNGTFSEVNNSPEEVSSAQCPGIYRIYLESWETNADFFTLCGTSSTQDIVIIPVHITTEGGILSKMVDDVPRNLVPDGEFALSEIYKDNTEYITLSNFWSTSADPEDGNAPVYVQTQQGKYVVSMELNIPSVSAYIESANELKLTNGKQYVVEVVYAINSGNAMWFKLMAYGDENTYSLQANGTWLVDNEENDSIPLTLRANGYPTQKTILFSYNPDAYEYYIYVGADSGGDGDNIGSFYIYSVTIKETTPVESGGGGNNDVPYDKTGGISIIH